MSEYSTDFSAGVAPIVVPGEVLSVTDEPCLGAGEAMLIPEVLDTPAPRRRLAAAYGLADSALGGL